MDRKKRQIRLSMKALQPEIIEEEKPVRETKRSKRAKKYEEPNLEAEEAQAETEPELTGMQVAWQVAQERAQSKAKSQRTKRVKTNSSEQEDILNRTLEKRLPTGA